MFDIFRTLFRYKEKESPDELGAFPVQIHVSAFPERRYLWTSRFLVILSIYQNNPVYMRIGIFCFLVSCIVSVVLIILTLVKVKEGDLYISTFVQMALNIFLCYLFYRQSGGFTPSVAPAAS